MEKYEETYKKITVRQAYVSEDNCKVIETTRWERVELPHQTNSDLVAKVDVVLAD